MNRNLINKIITELKAEKPDLSYVRGILETVLEGLSVDKVLTVGTPTIIPSVSPAKDDVTVMEKAAAVKIAGLQKAVLE